MSDSTDTAIVHCKLYFQIVEELQTNTKPRWTCEWAAYTEAVAPDKWVREAARAIRVQLEANAATELFWSLEFARCIEETSPHLLARKAARRIRRHLEDPLNTTEP